MRNSQQSIACKYQHSKNTNSSVLMQLCFQITSRIAEIFLVFEIMLTKTFSFRTISFWPYKLVMLFFVFERLLCIDPICYWQGLTSNNCIKLALNSNIVNLNWNQLKCISRFLEQVISTLLW